jgi:hypothetical protein
MQLSTGTLIEIYSRYRSNYDSTAARADRADYNWWESLEISEGIWSLYSLMLSHFSLNISNNINELGDYVARLRAWATSFEGFDEDTRFAALFEFVSPIATTALSLPYAIRSRFVFATAQLSHQANRVLDAPIWADNLPADNKIDVRSMRTYAKRWTMFPQLEQAISRIYSEGHRVGTEEFRDKLNHRMPDPVLIGHSIFIRRRKTNSGHSYAFGDAPPIDLNEIATELDSEFGFCLSALDRFKVLVREQVSAIRNFIPAA